MSNRREFIARAASALVVLPALDADLLNVHGKTETPRHVPLVRDNPSRLPLPEGKRVSFGLDYFTLDPAGEGLVLKPGGVPAGFKGKISLRLQSAMSTKDKVEVEVLLGSSGEKIGHLSVWYPTAMQLFETSLNAPAQRVVSEGVRLRVTEGTKPLFLHTFTPDNGSHFLLYQNGPQPLAFPASLYSVRSVQPFGWLEGCVLDGIQELYVRKRDPAALKALQRHMDLFLTSEGKLIYENPASVPSDDKFNNLEAGLPFSVIARHRPDHASVKLFMDYCKSRVNEQGGVKDNFLSTEGCYTVAYPLAVVARELKRPELFEIALKELEERIKHNTDEKAVYTRIWKDRGEKTYRNWGRGYVWFLLGLVRAGEVLEGEASLKNDPRVKRLREVWVHYAQLAISHQQPDHSWRAYLDLAETGFDTSATSGLGAALAHGQRIGWLKGFPKERLVKIRSRLSSQLTPDGLLNGICQHNAAGEELQKSSYRVIAQYVLGLMAQLDAHV